MFALSSGTYPFEGKSFRGGPFGAPDATCGTTPDLEKDRPGETFAARWTTRLTRLGRFDPARSLIPVCSLTRGRERLVWTLDPAGQCARKMRALYFADET